MLALKRAPDAGKLYGKDVNGITFSSTDTKASYDTGTIWTGTFGMPQLGGQSYWDNYGLIGEIAEVVIYDSVLSDTERSAIEDYLYEKYVSGS